MSKLTITLMVILIAYPIIAMMIMPIINKKKLMKQEEERDKNLSSLKINDKIITISGIYGRIKGVNQNVVKLEVAKGIVIEIDKASIMGTLKE